jgi:nucleotide-binding universal stress UspA family protein
MRVLLATDGSGHATASVEFLARLPHAQRLDLTILAVAPAPSYHGSVEVSDWMERHSAEEKRRLSEVTERAAQVFEGADANVHTMVVTGHAGEEIVKRSRDLRSDLIVVGAQGVNAVTRLILGSVSDFVATHAKCSVLVVRPSDSGAVTHPTPRLCVADDESPPAQFAMQQLCEFAWGKQVPVDLVHVIVPMPVVAELPFPVDTEAWRSEMRDMLERRAERLKKLSSNVQAQVVEASHIGEGLVQFANQRQSDLVVLGSTGRGLLASFLMGSVSRYVLRHSTCSVWIARPAVY